MGNNNTSGFQEVDTNSNRIDPEKSPQPQESIDDENHVEAQNEGAAVDESQGNHEKETAFASDDPVESNEGEAEKEADPPVDHRTAEMALDEAEGTRSELEMLVSSEQLIDHDEQPDLNMADCEVNKQDSFEKDGIDVKPLQEFEEVKGHTGTRIIKEESGDTTSSMKENGQGLETYLSASQDELDVLCTVFDEKWKQENMIIEEIPSTANCLTSKLTSSDILVNVNVTGSKELGEIDRGTNDIGILESEDGLVADSLDSKSDHLVFGNDIIRATSEETCSELTGQNSEGIFDRKNHDPDYSESSLDLDENRDGGESDATQESAIGKEQEACEMSCQFMEAQVTEYLKLDPSEESCQELEVAKILVPEFGDRNISSEFQYLNGQEGIEEGGLRIFNRNEELPEESIAEELEKVSSEGTEWPQSIPLQPEEFVFKDNNHGADIIPDDDQASNIENGSSFQLDQATGDPNHQSTSLAEETLEHQDKFQSSGQEATGRFSTGSNPDSFNVPPYLRKSPSFGFDLRIDARSEESDRTPLLFKTTVPRSFSSQPSCGYNAVEVEEKVIIRMGRSDSEKSGTPFLEFPNGEAEEGRAPKKQDNGNSTSKATKVKHSRRSSFFGGCICCTGVIN